VGTSPSECGSAGRSAFHSGTDRTTFIAAISSEPVAAASAPPQGALDETGFRFTLFLA
jgi:hypothetical protein